MSNNTQLDIVREAANRPPYKQDVCVNAGQLLAEIEREYLPRPSYDDGEPVQEGDIIADRNDNRCGHKVLSWSVRSDGQTAFYTGTSSMAIKTGERVKRLQNEVTDADGVPIRVGDTVWLVKRTIDDGPFKVTAVKPGEVSYETHDGRRGMCFAIGNLTHKEPDSLLRIQKELSDLLRGYGFEHKVFDLLRRQREVLEHYYEQR